MTGLLASITVLDIDPPEPGDRYVTCTLDNDDDTPTVILPYTRWHDLGRPAQITVTIHPGDTLTDTPTALTNDTC